MDDFLYIDNLVFTGKPPKGSSAQLRPVDNQKHYFTYVNLKFLRSLENWKIFVRLKVLHRVVQIRLVDDETFEM